MNTIRFTVPALDTHPVFTEGVIMSQSPKQLEKIGEEILEDKGRFEFKNTGCAVPVPRSLPDDESDPVQEAVPDMTGVLDNLLSDDYGAASSSGDISNHSVATIMQDVGKGKAPAVVMKKLQKRDTINEKSLSEQRCFFVDRSEICSTDARDHSSPILIQASPPTASSSKVPISLHHRDRRLADSPACSIFCEDEKLVLPNRKWTKSLTNMGDAVSWKIDVLNQFSAIKY
ncbi:MAG: hypothetical protein Q9191_002116 [Dirinaria sp. TL-2023a]